MPTQVYKTADGKRVPSVTTVIGRFKDAGALMYWAWNEGKEGRDFRETRDAAAEAGTMAHAAVETFVHGGEPCFAGDVEVVRKAETAFGAFKEWAQQSKLVVTHTEIPMISETYRFGGTMDAILVDDKRAIGDWKASRGLYPDYLIQIAAYGKLWEETHPEEPITGGYHLCRFDKEFGDFTHKWWAELDAAWDAFLHLRALYEIEKELKARVK